jgi:hypothetical protein
MGEGVFNNAKLVSVSSSEATLLDIIEISSHLGCINMPVQSDNLLNCGKNYVSLSCGCGIKQVPIRCKYSKVCSVCGQIRYKLLRKKYMRLLEGFAIPRYFNNRGLRLLTVTYGSFMSLPLLERGKKDFQASIRRFLRLDYIKSRLYGGIGCYEVKHHKVGDPIMFNDEFTGRYYDLSNCGYYLHCHMIVDSAYLDNRCLKGENSKLSKAWASATNGKAFICDIRTISSLVDVVSYVLKYISKVGNFTNYDKARYFKLSFKKRIVFTFGNFYNKKICLGLSGCPECFESYSFIDSHKYYSWTDDPLIVSRVKQFRSKISLLDYE